ncbi:MAG: hypothetical protein K9N55_13230 [Phycisphaerae bacterium]|nr:hypothetical protein [Phycisphaerae bacterium]
MWSSIISIYSTGTHLIFQTGFEGLFVTSWPYYLLYLRPASSIRRINPESSPAPHGDPDTVFTLIRPIHQGIISVSAEDPQGESHGYYIGRLDITVDTDKDCIVDFSYKLIEINASMESDPETAGVINEWENKVKKIVDRPLAEAVTNLSQRNISTSRCLVKHGF